MRYGGTRARRTITKTARRGTGAPRARRTIPIDNRISDWACAIYQIPDTRGCTRNRETTATRVARCRRSSVLGAPPLDAGTACAVPWYVLNGRSRRVVQRPTSRAGKRKTVVSFAGSSVTSPTDRRGHQLLGTSKWVVRVSCFSLRLPHSNVLKHSRRWHFHPGLLACWLSELSTGYLVTSSHHERQMH